MKTKLMILGQVMILVMGIMAISYAVGGEIEFVRADGQASTTSPSQEGFIPKWKVSNTPLKLASTNNRGVGAITVTTWKDANGIEYSVYSNKPNEILATSGDANTILSKANPQSGYNSVINKINSEGATQSLGEYEKSLERQVDLESLAGGPGSSTSDNPFNFNPDAELTKNFDSGKVGYAGYLLQGVALAGLVQQAVAIGTRQILGFEDQQAQVLGEAAFGGITAYHLSNVIEHWYTSRNGGTGTAGSYGTYVGVAIAVYYIWENYASVDTETVTFECTVWEPPTGGQNCEECNDQILGCSEYQCRSLGKGCQLLNSGTNEELCTWINRNDAEAPEITPWAEALTKEFSYSSTTSISPPDRGVKITPTTDASGCIPAYTPLQFGINLNEPATCKIDFERKESFEEMEFFFGSDTMARYNHTHIMSLPSLNATGTVITPDSELEMFIRCEDANGNSNPANFVFKFCVEEGQDFTPPLVVDTSIQNNRPIAYNLSSMQFRLFLNEPATCKWSQFDQSYEKMETTFGSCTREIRNAQVVYSCGTTLTGIRDRAENDFYFRCEDASGNKNTESHALTLIGTQPLYIDWAKPNGTIKDSTSPVNLKFEVRTQAGADEGNAFCYYKPSAGLGSYIQFKYDPVERNYQHTQDLTFAAGSYNYSIKCIDEGGNTAFKELIFDVETDIGEPVVSRAYREEGYLKIITNEESECVYNTVEDIECEYEFDDGVEMQTVGEDEHFVEWNTQETYYIKCKDSFGNPPAYNSCSIVARPSDGETL